MYSLSSLNNVLPDDNDELSPQKNVFSPGKLEHLILTNILVVAQLVEEDFHPLTAFQF